MSFQLENPPPKQKKEKYVRPPKEAPTEYSQAEPIHPHEEWFRHHYWKEKRKIVRQALMNSGWSHQGLFNFDNCGAECVIEYSKTEGKYRVRASYCKCRHCEPCMRAKANLLAGNLRKRLEEKPNGRYRFVTLTLRHSNTPLKAQVKRLYASFRKLRNSKLWKKSQRGGAAVLEVKWQPQSRRWHAHLHVIAEGSFIDQRSLSAAWHSATGDSQIVDIRQLSSEKDAAHYVAKYMSKGTNNEVWQNEEAASEWISATKGTRMCATFGTWRGFGLLQRSKEKGDWVAVDLLRHVASRARAGDVVAINLLQILEDRCQYNPGRKRQPKPPE